jgi:hypothetical protein
MEKVTAKKAKKSQPTKAVPNIARPIWGDQQMSCDECGYNDQDIDTYPCAKCHTRH